MRFARLPVRDAAFVLTPCGLLSASQEVRASDMVMDADLGAAQTAEILFSQIGASAVEAIRLLMVDPAHLERSCRPSEEAAVNATD